MRICERRYYVFTIFRKPRLRPALSPRTRERNGKSKRTEKLIARLLIGCCLPRRGSRVLLVRAKWFPFFPHWLAYDCFDMGCGCEEYTIAIVVSTNRRVKSFNLLFTFSGHFFECPAFSLTIVSGVECFDECQPLEDRHSRCQKAANNQWYIILDTMSTIPVTARVTTYYGQ